MEIKHKQGLFFNVVFAVTTILIAFFSISIIWFSAQKIPQAKNIFLNRNVVLETITVSIFLGLLIGVLKRKLDKWNKKTIIIISAILGLFIIGIQCAYICIMRPNVIYDNYLIYEQAQRLLVDKVINPEFYGQYFQRYGHNLPVLTWIYLLLKTAEIMNIGDTHLILCFFGMFMMDLALLASWGIAYVLGGRNNAFLFLAFSSLNPVIYIWTIWHYTTVLSLPFLMGAILFAILIPKARRDFQKIVFLLLFAGCTILGLRIRITQVILLIAIFICSLALCVWKKSGWKKIAVYMLSAACFMGVISIGCEKYEARFVEFDNTDAAFPTVHWIMMGLGETGTFNIEDLQYTQQFPTHEEKVEGDIAKIKERIENLGVVGLAERMKQKLQVTWQDGSRGYSSGWVKNGTQSKLYSYLCGDKADFFLLYCQGFYLFTLVLVLLGIVKSIKTHKIDWYFVMRLLWLGTILFYLLWESQDHYSIGMVFVIQILAVEGGYSWDSVFANHDKRVASGVKYAAVTLNLLMIVICLIHNFDICTQKKFDFIHYNAQSQYSDNDGFLEVNNKQNITQYFKTSIPFNRISVNIVPAAVPSSVSYNMELLDAQNNVIAAKSVTADLLALDNLVWDFETIVPSKSETYQIRLTSADNSDSTLQIISYFGQNDLYEGGEALVNNNSVGADMCFGVMECILGAYISVKWYVLLGGMVIICSMLMGFLLIKDNGGINNKQN